MISLTSTESINFGKALDAFGSSNGSDIIQYDYHGGNNQQWQLVKVN